METWSRTTRGEAAEGRAADAEFRTWLATIHREAQEHTERIRERSRLPSWLMR